MQKQPGAKGWDAMSQAQAMTDQDSAPTLGELISEHRARRHLSRPQLALLVGASLSSVKNWEGDRATPSPGYLSSLEEALGVQFVDDGDGRYHALDAAPAVDAPRVVVVVAGTAEAMEAALDRLGVPRAE
jgi:ribosome-binding protein aMBF1 (putative translation factor)